ncbi:lipopolysaccharide transport system permease protein [Pseudomonas sp. NFIX10]|uniref:ABC transporter permease n=1 Tax=unclassified Pseudomonas TaxID=196821 RepID=UPI0008F1EB21|nr:MULTISPECIES: ABC transporter permease [unclassified Pseudomonas]SFA70558.1 lipopolysaccharide transport system permease protein [Pseudomonas sp. NFIX10]SFE07139.1 lipopolysaccharide transport system permease protein [Pseudomonas sp. NFACC06-1]
MSVPQKTSSLYGLSKNLILHRHLIFQMTKREVIGRYRGSVLGLLWSFLNPLMMLSVYTFVFSVVFKSRWGISPPGTEESKTMFAIMLFAGLIVHAVFAEVINRSPNIVLSNVNYVKKVVFPLEILPIVTLGAALFHGLISLSVLILAYTIFQGIPHLTILLTPVVMLPLIILTLGLAWILASLGVYLQDVGQTTGIITTIMLFLSPVFFPLSSLPAQYQTIILLNPLTFIIEQMREIVIWGRLPDFMGLGVYLIVSVFIAAAGYAWFQKTRSGFADVL